MEEGKRTVSFVYEIGSGVWGWTDISGEHDEFVNYCEKPVPAITGVCQTADPEKSIKKAILEWFNGRTMNLLNSTGLN